MQKISYRLVVVPCTQSVQSTTATANHFNLKYKHEKKHMLIAVAKLDTSAWAAGNQLPATLFISKVDPNTYTTPYKVDEGDIVKGIMQQYKNSVPAMSDVLDIRPMLVPAGENWVANYLNATNALDKQQVRIVLLEEAELG